MRLISYLKRFSHIQTKYQKTIRIIEIPKDMKMIINKFFGTSMYFHNK